jgi:hypothetical protein
MYRILTLCSDLRISCCMSERAKVVRHKVQCLLCHEVFENDYVTSNAILELNTRIIHPKTVQLPYIRFQRHLLYGGLIIFYKSSRHNSIRKYGIHLE